MTNETTSTIVIRVAPSEGEYRRDDDRWVAELGELYRLVDLHAPGTVEPPRPAANSRGVELVEVVMTLASSGAFTAAVEGFKAWLGKKPDRRSLDLEATVGGTTRTVTLAAENIDSADLSAMVSAALEAAP